MITKVCKKCNIEKLLSCFPKSKVTTDKLLGSCKECQKEYLQKWRLANPEKVKQSSIKEKQQRSNYNKSFYQKNKERIDKRTKEHYKKWQRDRVREDPLYALAKITRNSIRDSFKTNKYHKSNKTEVILGCSFKEFKIYIESKFESWMNWENRGNWNGIAKEPNVSWDLDHIIPTSSAKTEEELIKLLHYSNIQPLCSYTNRWIKRNK